MHVTFDSLRIQKNNSASIADEREKYRKYFPLFVDLRGRRCVVVGAGEVAAHKVEGMIPCGAEIVVIGPRAERSIREAERAEHLTWMRRRFIAADLDGAFLAIAATSSRRVNAEVFQACRERGILCNSVDDPEHCNFIYPAVVRRGPLQIAVSTGGRSPALAAQVRQHLEERFGPEWVTLLHKLSKQRDAMMHTEMPAHERMSLLRAAAAEAAESLLLKDRKIRPARHKGHKSPLSATPTR